jgi:exopolyphosphatase/guanosine-5'-triphosphate,3'-diphosphate pyrophosphatase
VARALTLTALDHTVGLLSQMTAADRARLPGVSENRAGQLLAGAVVAAEALRACELDSVDVCPWALREGVILRRLDWLAGS